MIVKVFGMRRFIWNFGVTLVAFNGAFALDLTPREGFIQNAESSPIATLEFADGKMRYSYIPPTKWRPTGGGRTLNFFTPEADAIMKFMVVDKAKSQAPVDLAASQEDMQAWVAKFIPTGASKVQFVKLVPGPFPMGRRSSNEYIFTFDFAGTPTSLSISVVDFNDKERFLILVSASTKHFDQIHQQAISSMFSWAAVE